ncbi:MAG: formimidoylglutamate deiminase [Gammaproteobacteria bacterium]|nr:formimidoylglutamate deiminase [Gammaproteobacteria bacterium]
MTVPPAVLPRRSPSGAGLRSHASPIEMAGLASAHSHAFQRALRARTQTGSGRHDSFWTWRKLMYTLVDRLEPQDLFDIAAFAYAELAMSGVTAIGEFHYLHHARDGRPYADRLEMAEALIAAAREAGVRLTLIRTVYLRAGHGQEPDPAQRRFLDTDVHDALRDVQDLASRHRNEPLLNVAVAAHSVRALDATALREVARFARAEDLPLHMHVAEQPAEVEQCLAEHGCRPLRLAARCEMLDTRFVAVHATHLDEDEIALLGAHRAAACICRGTERDLGDGLPPIGPLLRAGAKLCTGTDSHCAADAFDEIRAIELDERCRTLTRSTIAAEQLLEIGTCNGYEALGMPVAACGADRVLLRGDDAALCGISDALLPQALVYAATARAVQQVSVDGRIIVSDGVHRRFEPLRERYLRCLRRLELL